METTTPKHSPERMRASDIASIKEDGEDAQAMMAALDKYLEPFAKPHKVDGKTICHNCGQPVDGMMQVFGMAVAYRWGLGHGEAECSGCGWPARGMHYIKNDDGSELVTLRSVFLPYHPDFVESGEAVS